MSGDFAGLYLQLGMLLGLAQVADGLMLMRRGGRPGGMAGFFSLAEWGWGAVSVYALLQQPEGLELSLPALYIAYLGAWLAYSLRMFRDGRADPRQLRLTPGETLVGMGFGLLFAGLALAQLLG